MFTANKRIGSRLADSQRLASISSSQAIIEFDPSGTILTANENFENCTGYKLADIRGKHHAILMPAGESETPAYRSFWQDLSKGKPKTGEFRRVNSQGEEIWLQGSYTPVYGANGKLVSILKTASDVTAIKLDGLEKAGQIAAINKSQAVIHFDMMGTILDANENFCSATGYALSEIIGRHHSIFIEKADQNDDYKAFWQNLQSGEFQSGEFTRVKKSGDLVFLQANYNPILDGSGKPYKVIKFATDITEQVLKRKELEEVSAQVDADLTRILEGVTSAASQVTEASAASEQTSSNVESVAAGATQLAASVEEISDQVSKASTISTSAVQKVQDAHQSVTSLSASANQIGEIINLISSIAEQTNLLALNATIEAARAGDAGKGFAVVAGEVKALANQSAKATDSISDQISAIQLATQNAVNAIDIISKVIEEVNEISVSISSAVEEQACVTRDISTNMGDATVAVSNISQGVQGIAEITNMIRTSTEQVKALSSRIAS